MLSTERPVFVKKLKLSSSRTIAKAAKQKFKAKM